MTMNSIQEIFDQNEFCNAASAVVQKMRCDPHNREALRRNYTEHWPALAETYDLIVVAIEEVGGNTKRREIWCGFLEDTRPTKQGYRFHADRFQLVGIHDRDCVADARFYGNGGGGGARVTVKRAGNRTRPTSRNGSVDATPEGMMVKRLVWVRKNHAKFRDPVHHHWEGKCAVANHDCDGHPGLLIASHIYPWARSTPKEQTDVDNGLLLSSPIDRLFDQGLISFDSDGMMLVSGALAQPTRDVFGIKAGMRIADSKKITKGMKAYLAKHRSLHGFP